MYRRRQQRANLVYIESAGAPPPPQGYPAYPPQAYGQQAFGGYPSPQQGFAQPQGYGYDYPPPPGAPPQGYAPVRACARHASACAHADCSRRARLRATARRARAGYHNRQTVGEVARRAGARKDEARGCTIDESSLLYCCCVPLHAPRPTAIRPSCSRRARRRVALRGLMPTRLTPGLGRRSTASGGSTQARARAYITAARAGDTKLAGPASPSSPQADFLHVSSLFHEHDL